ncbi:MAG TPA: DUF4258 domain-containing protein [Alphaproteobacteria bacterium]|nr:DUF4258 domain-containing protein [Alphaproteobacteria bacterium]
MPCPDVQYYRITEHARWEMQRRAIAEAEVAAVLNAPEQREEVRTGRCVYQSRLVIGDPSKGYLLRVFVDVDRNLFEVVTVYRTSKVQKY